MKPAVDPASGASLRRRDLRGADLRGLDLHGQSLYESRLDGADLSGANLAGANLRAACLAGANLRGADLCGADLNGADLAGADLTGARTLEMTLVDARVEGALGLHPWAYAGAGPEGRFHKDHLVAAMCRGEIKDLRGADLRRIYVEGADLSGVDFTGADLRRARLPRAILTGATLTGAKLKRAELEGSDLRGVDLAGLTLLHVWLKGAQIEGCRPWLAARSFGALYDGARCPPPALDALSPEERRALATWLQRHRGARAWATGAWGEAFTAEASAPPPAGPDR